MTTRDTRPDLYVSDVMPTQLQTHNRGPVLERCRSFRKYAGTNPNWPDHPDSVCGGFTVLVTRIEAAESDLDARRQWQAIEAWASKFGIEIT